MNLYSQSIPAFYIAIDEEGRKINYDQDNQ